MIVASDVAYHAEKNCRLILDLMIHHKAKGLGAVHNFFAVPATDWCCPCCYRSKPDIATLDKNENLICRFVYHHDHFVEVSSNVVALFPASQAGAPDRDFGAIAAVRDSFQRFPETLICEHCNNADAAAKAIVAAPKQFSFTPWEISAFIVVAPNIPHKIDIDRAHQTFEAAKPAMAAISDRLRALRDAVKAPPDGFEPLAASAFRALAAAHKKRQDNSGNDSA